MGKYKHHKPIKCCELLFRYRGIVLQCHLLV